MPDTDPSYDVAQVEMKLSRAWKFLSGEKRGFQYVGGAGGHWGFAEFSFLMPLDLAHGGRCGGVGVLIQHADAVRVATNMFGVARQDIQQADLGDACAEVCNVFSDCLAMHFSTGQEVKMGLPRWASPLEYESIAEYSVIRAIYQGCAGSVRLRVVLYDSLSSRLEVSP